MSTKITLMKKLWFTISCMLLGFWGMAQATYTWLPAGGGVWTTTTNWTPTRTAPAATDILIIGGAGNKTITAVPTQQIGRLTITGTTNVTLQAGGGPQTLTIGNGTGDDLIVEAGRTLNIATSLETVALAVNATANISGTYINNSNFSLTAAGVVTTVSGTFSNTGNGAAITNPTATKLVFAAGAIYQHARNDGAIPTASWNATSNCNLTGVDDDFPTGMNQNFGNVLFASDIDNGNIDIQQSFTTQGNFTISNTGADDIRVSNNTTNYTIGVSGNFSITSGNFVLVSDEGDVTMDVTGNFSQSGGTFTLKEDEGVAALIVDGDFSKTGGTFNQRSASTVGTSILTVSGNFSHTSGTYTMSAVAAVGTLNLAGNFSHTGGTITEGVAAGNNGAVVFNGAGTQVYTSGGTITNGINFTVNTGSTLEMAAAATAVTGAGNFTLQANAFLIIKSPVGITTAGATGNVQVTGTRTYTTGAHYVYKGSAGQVTGNGLTQNTPASLEIDNPTTVSLSATTVISGNLLIRVGTLSAVNGVSNFNLTVGGNWTNTGTAFTPGTALVTLNGTALQTIGGTTVSTFNNLNLTKTTGIVVLAQSANVNATLNIGVNFILGTHNLTMGAASPLIGTLGAGAFGPTKMIVANGTGQLRKTFTNVSTPVYAFPIGDTDGVAEYSPAGITFSTPTSTTGFVAVNVTDDKHDNNGHDNSFLSRFWTVTQSTLTGWTAQVGFTYVDADIEGTIANEANIRLGKWDGQGPWTRYGAGSINTALNSMLSDPITSFSDFTGLDFLEILPVNFGTLRGWAPNMMSNAIEWNVFGETGVDRYEIQKLHSGDVFRKIGTQNPDNSGLDVKYTFVDNEPHAGDNFYRIKGIELSGEISYSPVVRVRNGATTTAGLRVYPNPVRGNTMTISLQNLKAGKYEMIISNSVGQVVYSNRSELQSGNILQQIPLKSSLPKGIYRIRVSNGEEILLTSFIKE